LQDTLKELRSEYETIQSNFPKKKTQTKTQPKTQTKTQPPPPKTSGGGPPPPPGSLPPGFDEKTGLPPPTNQSRGDLLNSIQGFSKNKLKKAPKVEEKPLSERLGGGGGGGGETQGGEEGGTKGGLKGSGDISIAQMALSQLGKLKKTGRKNE